MRSACGQKHAGSKRSDRVVPCSLPEARSLIDAGKVQPAADKSAPADAAQAQELEAIDPDTAYDAEASSPIDGDLAAPAAVPLVWRQRPRHQGYTRCRQTQ